MTIRPLSQPATQAVSDQCYLTAGLTACLLGAASLLLITPGSAEAFDVKFRAFNESGVELTVRQVNQRMTNSRVANLSAGTINLATLEAVTLNENYSSGGKWTMPFPGSGLGMMVHWNTTNTGYSTFLLDRQGKGFSAAETVILNQVLAEDAKRQFDAALTAKYTLLPGFTPSAAFNSLKGQLDPCFTRLTAAVTASDKGRIGQECLDLVAQAMTVMMREVGTQRAGSPELSDSARWGVTITPEPSMPLSTDTRKIDDLVALFEPKHRWARIEMVGDGTDNLPRIKAIVDYANAHGVKTMGQLFDSTSQATVPLATFKNRVNSVLNYAGMEQVTAWEVGNEVNGGWLGSNVPAKITYAASSVKAKWPGKNTVLTFYWTSIQDELSSSLFNWIGKYATAALVANVDAVALSIYTDEQPLNFTWDRVMSRLAERFPGKAVMSGELDFDPRGYYKEGAKTLSAEQGYIAYIKNRYASSFATPNSIGGGFWWYFSPDMVGRTSKWQALRDIYCAAYGCK
jgi:hypothetical protein